MNKVGTFIELWPKLFADGDIDTDKDNKNDGYPELEQTNFCWSQEIKHVPRFRAYNWAQLRLRRGAIRIWIKTQDKPKYASSLKESKEEGDGLKTEARMSLVYFHLESLRFSTSSPNLHLTQVT